VRIADSADFKPLNRALIDRLAGYGRLGNRRIVAVYRKSVPWSSGELPGGARVSSFAHFVYLKLNGPLEPGNHQIEWPGGVIPATNFNFEASITRSSSIRANQNGYRANDVSKYAYLALWLPGGPEDGAVDFRGYGIREFHIINDRNERVFTGGVVLRIGPKEAESIHGPQGNLRTYTLANGDKYQANRSGTFVFGLDFSAWQGAPPGKYRLLIEQLGTSDPFSVDETVWYRAARVSMAGLYHQRSGLALDGRFGYSRPECFTEASGVVVRQSKMPLVFSKEGGGFMDFVHAAKAPWISEEIVSNAWGGYQDAGDWDRRIDHVRASYILLDVYEQLPSANRHTKFGIPQSEEVLPHPLYKGAELPDLVNEAIWNLDFFRRLQRSDGAVRGGIESAQGPAHLEPCWLESNRVFAYAPDPLSTFEYAGGAAKLAIILRGLGREGLANLYAESALRAWAWAEKALAEPEVTFDEARRLLQKSDDEYEKLMSPILDRTRLSRLWSATTLFRLTGSDRFHQVVLKPLGGWIGAENYDAAWEYANAKQPNVDHSLQRNIRSHLVEEARRMITHPQRGKVAYRTMQWKGAPLMWGSGTAPNHIEAALLIRAHKITGAKEFLATMLDGSAYILGANQIGMTLTTGLGSRWPQAPLHEDSIAAGIPAPIGITIYGWAAPEMMGYWFVWGPQWAPLSDQVPTKRVEPIRTALPVYEFLIDHPRIIISAEYTVQQTIATTLAIWIYLNGFEERSRQQ
jgi:endoglucanase